MKRLVLISVFIIVGLAVTAGFAQAHQDMMGSGMMSGQAQGQTGSTENTGGYYPCQMGGGMMGPGMMMGSGMMGYGMGSGMMHGMDMMGYGGTEENKKFLDDTAGMRRELHIKKFDYFEALRNPDSKAETIGKLIKDIQVLQKKIYEKSQTVK